MTGPAKTIIVASKNPVKLQAVQQGYRALFPGEEYQVSGVDVPSGVSRQPSSDFETYQGACNRARRAAESAPWADYWVGIEGGVETLEGGLVAFAWIVIQSPAGQGEGRTGTFFLPPAVARLVEAGLELGEADDQVFGRSNSKQEEGAIGLLTGRVIDRAALYTQAVILALIPFANPALYFESK